MRRCSIWRHLCVRDGGSTVIHHARRYSILTTAPCQHINVTRTGGINVPISVFEPLLSIRDAPARVVLYFPRGPLLKNNELDEQVISILRSTLPYPVVQVDYAFDNGHQHPHPIHDATAAYDWAVEYLLPSTSKWTGRPGHRGGIATCGELLGGTLATALALSECRAGEVKVLAAAVSSPVLDWVDLEPKTRTKGRKKSTPRSPELTVEMLEKQRDALFRKPEHYYDPFASPLLFFRSAGSVPPQPTVIDNDVEIYDAEDLLKRMETLSVEDNARPRSSRMFPSTAHNLTLPAFQVSSAASGLLTPQVEEFVQQYGASLLRQRKSRRGRTKRRIDDFYDHDPVKIDFEELLAKDSAYVDSRLQLMTYNGSGLWDAPATGRAMIHDMANWLRQKLAE